MKQRWIIFGIFCWCSQIAWSLQTVPPQPVPRASTPPTVVSEQELERRIYRVETAQTQTVHALEASIDSYRTLITVVGVLFSLLVTIQTVMSFYNARRERAREDRQTNREQEKDKFEIRGVDQVAKIMSLVEQMLASRLAAEEQARLEAQEAQKRLDEVLERFGAFERFYRNFQTTIKTQRKYIEEWAGRLAKLARHDFRREASNLNQFSQQFDTFKAEFEALEEEPRSNFTARVPYSRGIAAHYANQPELVEQYLTEVVTMQQPEIGETEIQLKRRLANAYYYLGLTHSNFGNSQEAIASFENANSLDLDNKDFLTRVVTAEAYIMNDSYDKAREFISGIEKKLQELEKTERPLRHFHLHLRSRAALLGANMLIVERGEGWLAEAERLLLPIHQAEPQYYYATATLAQIRNRKGDSAEGLFREAHESIEHSGDLMTVTEIRSRILLLMVAALCCKHGLHDEGRASEHLDRAEGLRSSLPRSALRPALFSLP